MILDPSILFVLRYLGSPTPFIIISSFPKIPETFEREGWMGQEEDITDSAYLLLELMKLWRCADGMMICGKGSHYRSSWHSMRAAETGKLGIHNCTNACLE